MEEKIYKWILINKISGIYCDKHVMVNKPKFGNNGKETDTSEIFEWIEWNKPLPDDIDREEGYTLKELEELYAEMD